MPHANIIDGQYVDDDFQPVDGPEFDPPSWLSRTFREVIAQLASQRDFVPPGWHRLFNETLDKLRAVSCPRRNGIELSEIAFGRGEMVIAAQGGGQHNDHGSDRVVQGILNRLRQASAATCACCGTRLGVAYRRDSFATLCDRCHIHQQLDQVIDGFINEDSAYTEAPLIEWDALPLNIQAIIPQDQIKTAHLKALGVRIRYVEPETLQSLQPALKLLKRALVASRGG
jgi:hypothetical protein